MTGSASLRAALRRIFLCWRKPKPEDDWTPYHELRKRTDPPPWGMGRDE